MANILVTGGAGYIGSHTVVELAAAGHNPVIIDNYSNSDPIVLKRLGKIIGKPIPFYEQNFQDVDTLDAIVSKESIEGIIHFAAYKAVGESVSKPLKYYQNNVSGLITLLAKLQTLPVKYFVFSSSCTVYGEQEVMPITESSPVKPAESPYGATKQMDEIILRDTVSAGARMSAVALRYFNPIGAHPSSLIGELPRGVPANLVPFVTQTAAGIREKLIVHGTDYDTPDGSCIRDYIHVCDLAKAHVKTYEYLTKQSSASFEIANVGTGTGSSVLDVIQTFESVTGIPVPYEIGPRRAGDIITNYASVDKATEMLGWKAEKSLADALLDAWHWQQTLGDAVSDK